MTRARSQPEGFALFAFTWAMAGLFHQLSFDDWRWHSAKGGLLSAAIVGVLLKPSAWVRLAVLALVDLLAVASEFPHHPNHVVFAWIVNATLLASLGFARRARDADDPEEPDFAARWQRVFAPWLRVELCVLYFFTVFAKLNSCFFDVDWSCAAKMYREVAAWVPGLPPSRWAETVAIDVTLVAEAAIPALLLCRRTRAAGAIVGIAFHAFLALHRFPGIYSFSATMAALFTVFLPAEVAAALRAPAWLRRVWPWALAGFAVLCVAWFVRDRLPGSLRLEEHWRRVAQAGLVACLVYLLGGLCLCVQAMRAAGDAAQGPAAGTCGRSRPLVVLPLLLVANGAGPYLGLRTETSFTMFSNLQTENGRSNHLLVPASIQVTDWQRDLVEIVASNEPDLAALGQNGLLLPYLDLRRRRSEARANFCVTFRRQGAVATYDAARPETRDALPPLSWIACRYLYFRPVERDPARVKCRH